ncbi:MAG: hypothetical protein Q8J70_00265 [Thiobacillus sp.]|nr:hypothetical protein [Thiobacillus sp.]
MKPTTWFELVWHHKPWHPRQLCWIPAGGQAGGAALAQLERQAHWHDGDGYVLARVKCIQGMTGDDLALRDALPIRRDPSAFRFDTLNAKHFADTLMINMAGITTPPVVQKVEPA